MLEDKKGTIWDEDIPLETRVTLQFVHYLQNLRQNEEASRYLSDFCDCVEWEDCFCLEDVGFLINGEESSGWHHYGYRVLPRREGVIPRPYWDDLEWERLADGSIVARSENAKRVEADLKELNKLDKSS